MGMAKGSVLFLAANGICCSARAQTSDQEMGFTLPVRPKRGLVDGRGFSIFDIFDLREVEDELEDDYD